ncbi:hypothetical protein YC2023_074110 [Brassica napus]
MVLSFNQAIELSDVKFMQEKKLTGKYFEEILLTLCKCPQNFHKLESSRWIIGKEKETKKNTNKPNPCS